MMYCMSDIHGVGYAFDNIMRQIDLQPDDKLYIIGDVIDRGPDGIALLQRIMEMPNCTFLLGNHEQMMLYAYTHPDEEKRKLNLRAWKENSSYSTRAAFERLSAEEQEKLLDFLRNAPIELNFAVGERKYCLVHACPLECFDAEEAFYKGMNDVEYSVWHRVYPEEELLSDRTVVFGHTPTMHFQDNEPQAVWFGDNRICIDCGAGLHSRFGGRLGCLRLDDMQEFYAEISEDHEKLRLKLTEMGIKILTHFPNDEERANNGWMWICAHGTDYDSVMRRIEHCNEHYQTEAVYLVDRAIFYKNKDKKTEINKQ